jgi:hypothetical protein
MVRWLGMRGRDVLLDVQCALGPSQLAAPFVSTPPSELTAAWPSISPQERNGQADCLGRISGGRQPRMILVAYNIESTSGEGPHDTQVATARSLDWNGGSNAYRNDCADAFSFYRFHERRWSVEMLRHYRHSKSVLNLTVRRSDLLSMNERAQAVTHHARK